MSVEWQSGVVKSVTSGDTVVIRGTPQKGPPSERTLCLAGVQAPRLGLRPRTENETTTDEPYAWESRDALRTLLIGKPVRFCVDYHVATIGREFGRLTLQDKDVTQHLVREGALKTRQGPQTNEDFDTLVALEEQAKNAQKGVWSSRAASCIRKVTWNVDNPQSLVDPTKTYDAFVEQVRDGSTVRVFLLPSFQYVTIQLAGIKCPGFKTNQADPYAAEARYFVESRLLQRNVKVTLLGVTNNNFLGTVRHQKKGDITEAIVREGMARVVDWSLNVLPNGKEAIRAAEAQAKEKRLRLFHSYVAANAGVTGEKDFQAKVVEISNPETIVVLKADGSKVKLTLSSIRSPKMPEGEDRPKSSNDIPFMFDAREFLRKRVMGKKVHCLIDYVKPGTDGYPEKVCATVLTSDKQNVAEALLSKGFATLVKYKPDDEARSSQYDLLYTAEARAVEQNRGLHKKGNENYTKPIDLSTEKERAKAFFGSYQRAGKCEGVVDYVINASRFKLYVPKDNIMVVFLLAGINVPRTGRKGEESEPYAEDASRYIKDNALQHDVQFTVESQDRMGNFIGSAYVNGLNLALALVEVGFASVHSGSAHRLPYGSELEAAEKVAKEKRIGIWTNYVEPKAEEKVEDGPKERKVTYTPVVVSEVTSANQVYVQTVPQSETADKFLKDLNAHFEANPPKTGYTPAKGERIAAKFSDDDCWYRAISKGPSADGKSHTVTFIDYGNSENVLPENIADLPSDFTAAKECARSVNLACIKVPADEDWVEEARLFMLEGILNRTYNMNVEYQEDGKDYVTLVDPEAQADVGKTMLAAGFVLVESRREPKLRKLITEYKTSLDHARENRRNIWQYGDFEGEEALDFGYTAPAEKGSKK
ncbi:hypothetical protein SARC_07366 [Sphaeroforma arctica JP610]|uniref:Staphylococcal nuclease domain-containing protein n=1 Tax=Sphaeroforma arctica JP610 TaxID=667725 RepID=A0A0L0FTX2_9EUKA|nr:hypothetical protein SARC_07366 [Sphaeroforma arctica JP610]KNC80272.1 hypothetical protein SARC_07366 [Sphaeroforma arctica JP610]|eukprot:XP_014154174.1 hypothetical protein SARC_07366 [Sphaeroforma arctica JP610]